jgi:hypothetical protein
LIALLLAGCALVVAGPIGATAQQATPTASPLASLGLPELKITATDQGFQAPASVAAGWYLVTLDNQSKSDLTADTVLLPSGQSLESMLAIVATPAAGPPPAWVYQTTWAGGSEAAAGQSAQAIIHLTEGNWMIWNGGSPTPAPVALTVTAATGTVSAPNATADVDVTTAEYTFAGLANPVPAGEHVWKVTNKGAQPHFMSLAKLPDGTTQKQLTDAINAQMSGTPVAGGLDLSQIAGVGGTSTLSTGQSLWTAFDLAPGTYAAVCFFPDIQSGLPHAALGMAVVFTVK